MVIKLKIIKQIILLFLISFCLIPNYADISGSNNDNRDELIIELPIGGFEKNDIRFEWNVTNRVCVSGFAIINKKIIIADHDIYNNDSARLHLINIETNKKELYKIADNARILGLLVINNNNVGGVLETEKTKKYVIFNFDISSKKYEEKYVSKEYPYIVGLNEKEILLLSEGPKEREIVKDCQVIATYYSSEPKYLKINIETGNSKITKFSDARSRNYIPVYQYEKGKAIVKRETDNQNYEVLIKNKIPKELINYGYYMTVIHDGYILINYYTSFISENIHVLSKKGEKKLIVFPKANLKRHWAQFVYKNGQLNYYYKENTFFTKDQEYHLVPILKGGKVIANTKGYFLRIYKKSLKSEKWHD